MQVAPGSVDELSSTAAGEGLIAATCGVKSVFVIRAVDRFGNSVAAVPKRAGHAGFSAKITGSKVCFQQKLPVVVPTIDAQLHKLAIVLPDHPY